MWNKKESFYFSRKIIVYYIVRHKWNHWTICKILRSEYETNCAFVVIRLMACFFSLLFKNTWEVMSLTEMNNFKFNAFFMSDVNVSTHPNENKIVALQSALILHSKIAHTEFSFSANNFKHSRWLQFQIKILWIHNTCLFNSIYC